MQHTRHRHGIFAHDVEHRVVVHQHLPQPLGALVESEPERTQGLRQMLVDNYSVFYIVGEDAVSVARVLYSASDLVRRLRRMK